MRAEPPFSLAPVAHLPAPDPGCLRVAAKLVAKVDGQKDDLVRLAFSAGWTLAQPEAARFGDPTKAINVHVTTQDGAGAWSARMIDPNYEPLEYRPNFTGNPTGWGSPNAFSSAAVSCLLRVPNPAGGPLFVHATMLDLVSNVLRIDPATGEVADAT